MRNKFKLFGFITALFLCAFLLPLNAEQELPFNKPEATISMDLQDANLKDILKIFSIQSGLNFIASESLQDRKITLYFDKVPIKEAMDKLFKANNLSYELDPDSNIFIVKDLGKPQIETVTKVFYLKYATVSSSSLKGEIASQLKSATSASGASGSGGGEDDTGISKAVKKLLSTHGSLVEDPRTNSIVVTDISSRMPVITQIIASLDVPIPQVILEVEILDVSKNAVDKMGFEFGTTPFTAVITGASGAIGFPFSSWGKTFFTEANRGNLAINTGTNTYQMKLDFLRTQTDTKFLARPKLITLNNETAEIKIATNESIGVKSTTASAGGSAGTTTAEAERTETGVILRVTPQANIETGEITMFVYPKVSEAVTGSVITSAGQSYVFRDPEERSTKSAVSIKDGETVVLGGLIRNEFSQVNKKLPIFGDVPVIGFLFRHKGGDSDKNKQRELLVFITPHIVKDTNVKLAQVNKVKFSEREQNTTTVFDRQSAISASLNNFERKRR